MISVYIAQNILILDRREFFVIKIKSREIERRFLSTLIREEHGILIGKWKWKISPNSFRSYAFYLDVA